MQLIKRKKRPVKKQYNNVLVERILISLIFLAAFGLIMIFSAAGAEGSSYFWKQFAFVLVGFLGVWIIGRFRMISIWKLTPAAYAVGIICIILLRTPLGVTVNGARRWLRIVGPIRFQVAEIVKITVILLMAYMIHKHPKQKQNPVFTIYLWLAGGVPALMLLVISNDLSSGAVVLGITFLMSCIFEKTPRLHGATFLGAAAFVVMYVLRVANNMPDPSDTSSFRALRIAAWIDPERYSSGTGYQTTQSILAIGSGGLFGRGLGNGLQKWGALPEAHTDFIFAVICEELGVIGAGIVIGLYCYLLYQIVRVAARTQGLFEAAIVTGVFVHIAVQVLFNLGVAIGFLPNTGLPLPLLSYGGTSASLMVMEVGLVIKIEKRNWQREIEQRQEGE